MVITLMHLDVMNYTVLNAEEHCATHIKPNLYYLVKQWQLTQVPKHTLYCAYQSHITYDVIHCTLLNGTKSMH